LHQPVDDAARGGGNRPAFRGSVSLTAAGTMRKAMKVRAFFCGVLLATATILPATVGAGEAITMKVSPAVSFAPANLVVRTTILSDADNRSVEICAESADFYRSSEIQLEGDKAARTTTFEFRSLPPGTYEVRAILYGISGRRGIVRQQINVIAGGAGDR
jgi:hypothetical protein